MFFLVQNEDIIVNILAQSFFGAKHGLVTLNQLVWFDDEDLVLKTYGNAEIIDAPKFK